MTSKSSLLTLGHVSFDVKHKGAGYTRKCLGYCIIQTNLGKFIFELVPILLAPQDISSSRLQNNLHNFTDLYGCECLQVSLQTPTNPFTILEPRDQGVAFRNVERQILKLRSCERVGWDWSVVETIENTSCLKLSFEQIRLFDISC